MRPGLSLTRCVYSTHLSSPHQLPTEHPVNFNFQINHHFFQLKYAVQNLLYFYWLKLATYPQVGGNTTQNSQGKAVLPRISSLPVEPVVQSPKLLARCPHCYLHRRGLKGCVLGCKETIFSDSEHWGARVKRREITIKP